MNDQQIALIKWRWLIIDQQPEVTPVFEVNGNVITLYLTDMSIAYTACKYYPQACGFGLRIFCGGEVQFIVPVRKT